MRDFDSNKAERAETPRPGGPGRVGLTGIVALIAAGCSGDITTVTDKTPMEPLPVYAEWWSATETCSQRSADMSRISWFTASSIQSRESLGWGLWREPHEIVILRGFEEDEKTVRHEMLHDLLNGDPAHEDDSWAACDLIFT